MPEHHLAQLDKYFYRPPHRDFGPREFRRILLRHKLLLVTIVSVITTGATIVMLLAKPTYLASCILEIRRDSTPILKTGGTPLPEESDVATIIDLKTKIVTMKSHELIEDVVDNLQLDRNSRFLDGADQWSVRRLFNWNPNAPHRSVIQPPAISKPEEDSGRSALERARLDPFVRLIETSLNIEQIKETRALKVSFIHTDPLIAAAVADGVARNFIQRNFQGQTERFSNTVAWLNQSTLELKERVEKAEQKLAHYTRVNNIFTTEGASTLTTDKLAKLHDQVTRAEADRILKETLFEEVRRGRVAEVPEVFAEMTSRSSPRITELQKLLGQLTATEAQMGVYFGPSNPQLQEVRRQIAAIREQIEAGRKSLNDKLQAEYEHAVLDEESLKAALAQAKAEAVNENQAAIQYNVLKQEVDTAKALYTEFLQKSNQSKIQAAEQYSNIRMIDHAKAPLHAYGPRRALIILLWFTISLVVGIGSALLLEYFDNSLKNGEDVTRFLQLSTLASIPRSKTISDGLAAGTETYHALRTSLLHSTEGPPKTILVTSIEPGDGKTTTTINLALSFSELGLRVLVIDGDMRHPMLHQAFGLEQHLGLSTYLSEEMSVNQLIYCPGKPNLSLLLGGPIPHPQNPANLIGSAKMKLLLDDLSQQYDQILIDSTEIGSVTDPAILSTMVDGVLLVVNAARNRSEIVRRAKYDLMNVGARILGVVLNQVDPRQTTDDK